MDGVPACSTASRVSLGGPRRRTALDPVSARPADSVYGRLGRSGPSLEGRRGAAGAGGASLGDTSGDGRVARGAGEGAGAGARAGLFQKRRGGIAGGSSGPRRSVRRGGRNGRGQKDDSATFFWAVISQRLATERCAFAIVLTRIERGGGRARVALGSLGREAGRLAWPGDRRLRTIGSKRRRLVASGGQRALMGSDGGGAKKMIRRRFSGPRLVGLLQLRRPFADRFSGQRLRRN
jgi:hypothetical protein